MRVGQRNNFSLIPTATLVLDPADQVCRTVTFVLLVVIEDEYEQIDGSALHHEYMDLIWVSMSNYTCNATNIHSLLHTNTHYLFLKTRENCRSHSSIASAWFAMQQGSCKTRSAFRMGCLHVLLKQFARPHAVCHF